MGKLISVIIFCTSLIIIGCEYGNYSDYELNKQTVYSLGTRIDIEFTSTPEVSSDAIKIELERMLHQFHQDYHAWQPSILSDIEDLCKNTTISSIAISKDTSELIKSGQNYERLSMGFFNPASGDLIELWGFLSDDMLLSRPAPSDTEINLAIENIASMNDLIITNNDSGLNLSCNSPNIRLDVGGYGKGYILDKMIAYLESIGVKNALINGGGDVIAYRDIDGPPWQVALNDFGDDSQTLQVIPIETKLAVATSGLSQRFFEWEGKTYAHIINPRTGYPVENQRKVTVLADNLSDADAIATAIIIAGPEYIEDFISQIPSIKQIIWTDSNNSMSVYKD